MKVLNFLLIGVFLLICFVPSNIEASEYLGERCWQMECTTPEDCTSVVKVGLFKMARNHLYFSGTILEIPGSAIHGNLVRNGNQYSMSFLSTGIWGNDKWADMGNAVLDARTLSGDFFWVGTHYSQGMPDPLGNHYDAGTMTRIPCPQSPQAQ